MASILTIDGAPGEGGRANPAVYPCTIDGQLQAVSHRENPRLKLGHNPSHAASATLSAIDGVLTLLSDGGPNLTVNAISNVIFAATQHLAGLNIGSDGLATIALGGDKIVVTNDLSIATGGTLDLTDSDLVVHATPSTSASVLADLTDKIAAGYGTGASHWTNPGINSFAAAVDANKLTAVGVLLNRNNLGEPTYTRFSGEPVGTDSVLIKWTYYGDANLSGHVDGGDYALIDNGFNFGLSGWFNGDFNYDGQINGTDYSLIDNAFNFQGVPLATDWRIAQALTAPAGGSAVLAPVDAVARSQSAEVVVLPKPLQSAAIAAVFGQELDVVDELKATAHRDARRELADAGLDEKLLDLLVANV